MTNRPSWVPVRISAIAATTTVRAANGAFNAFTICRDRPRNCWAWAFRRLADDQGQYLADATHPAGKITRRISTLPLLSLAGMPREFVDERQSDRRTQPLMSRREDAVNILVREEVMAMDSHDLTFRLIGTQVPAGELGLSDLADICHALQDLNTKISRLVAGQNIGRTGDAAARVAQLRFTGIGEGSTVLDIGYGEANALPDPELSTFEDQTSDMFWEIIAGITTGARPDWATDGVAKSAIDVADALAHSAQTVEVKRADNRLIRFETPFFVRQPWQASEGTITDETVTLEGELRAVDLETHRFRIRDDAGNAIALWSVQNQEDAATLIGSRATATGLAVRGRQAELKALSGATVASSKVPGRWRTGVEKHTEREKFTRQRPEWSPIPDLTDDESDDFMAAISG